jgi:hypothetical protein
LELAKRDKEAKALAAENALQKAHMEQIHAMLMANGLTTTGI